MEIIDLKDFHFNYAFEFIIYCNRLISRDLLKELPKECKGVINDGGTLCKIVNLEILKWNSIKYVIRHLNCKMLHVIAVGDYYSDMEMIGNCKMGVVMKNTIDELKFVEKFVIKSNDEDGVATFFI